MSNNQHLKVTREFCEQSIELLNQSEIKTQHCLHQLSDDQIWWRPEPTLNSIGNLVRHVSGNLRQWGVVPLTAAADDRNRAREFATDEFYSRTDLLEQLSQTISSARQLWGQLEPHQLTQILTIQGFRVSLMQAILHTSSHLVGHTHQVVMLTRLQLGADYRFHWTPEDRTGELPI